MAAFEGSFVYLGTSQAALKQTAMSEVVPEGSHRTYFPLPEKFRLLSRPFISRMQSEGSPSSSSP